MNISSKTVLYTMRSVGCIIIVAALGLIVYLIWITSRVGLDGFLISGLGLGVISLIVGSAMIYFSFRIAFEEVQRKTENLRKKEHLLSRKCG